MIHVTPINDEDWRERGWLSAASATCEQEGCEAFQLIGVFRKDAWAATLEYGELALNRKLEDQFAWRKGLCPEHKAVERDRQKGQKMTQEDQAQQEQGV